MKRFYGGLLLACVAVTGIAWAQETEPPQDRPAEPRRDRAAPERGFRGAFDRGDQPGGFGRTERSRRLDNPLGILRGEVQESAPAGKLVSLDLVIVEANKTGKSKPVIDLSNTEKIPEILKALEEKGEASVISRVRIAALEQQPCSVQIGESRPMATGRTASFPSGRGERSPGQISYQFTNVGTNVQVTSRVEDSGDVVTQLSISASRLAPAEKPEEEGAIVPGGTTTLSTQTTLRIPKDQGVIVSASQSNGNDESRETLIIASAHVEGKSAAASVDGKSANADVERVLKVYSLQNASAEQAAKLLNEIADSPIQVTADARTNSLIVRTSNSNADEVTALLERLDSTPEAEAPKK